MQIDIVVLLKNIGGEKSQMIASLLQYSNWSVRWLALCVRAREV